MTALDFSTYQEKDYIRSLIERIVAEAPRRQPTSEDERKAHQIMKAEFAQLGLDVSEHSFLFNDNLYANIALHFGLGSLGTVLGGMFPAAGLLLHLLAATSYKQESTRKRYLLRRLFPWKPSQNVLGILPAREEMKLRVVFAAHADAAFTGWLFQEQTVRTFGKEPPKALHFMKRSMELATKTQFALAYFDALRLVLGPLTLPLRPLEWALSIPGFLAFMLNMDVVLRNQIVPGANDDLSGVSALPVMARRLAKDQHPNVEYVFVTTGCEEASLGGADALARDMEGVWDKRNTVVIGLDGLSLGDLRYARAEGEVEAIPVPAWLRDRVDKTAASESRFHGVTGFDIPVGATDVGAFLAHGYEGVCLICVDPELGAPRHYHLPEDTPENLDVDQVLFGIDFAERLTRDIVGDRLPVQG